MLFSATKITVKLNLQQLNFNKTKKNWLNILRSAVRTCFWL